MRGWLAVLLGSSLLAVAGVARPDPAPSVESVAATLRDALVARAAGDAAGAAAGFAAAAAQGPEVADHAEELRIDALVAAGAFDEGLAAAAAFRASPHDPWLLARVAAHEGALHVARGDEAAAREAFARAQALGVDEAEAARLEAEIAASFERSGDRASAARHWLVVYTRYATSAESDPAELALTRLAAADPGLRVRSAAVLRERCERLSNALHNEAALRECDAALGAAPRDRALRREAAELRFRTRRYTEAVEAFAALGPRDLDARFWRARALARSGRIDESIAAFRAVADAAPPELAARARFLMGTLQEDDDVVAAEVSYGAVAERAPLASQRSAARWRLAWLAWRRGDVAAAGTGFERYLADETDPAERRRGLYWRARALDRTGQPDGQEQLAALAREAPLSYYGWRAAQRVAGQPAAADVASAPVPPPAASASEGPALPPLLLRRIEILLAAGLEERAAREVRPLTGKAASRATRLALGQLLLEAGQFQRAQRLVLDAEADALDGAPTPDDVALWWLAWPTAFDRAVRSAAAAQDVPEALVYAIMREESGYRPDARSVVGARGLTQIMPDTGRRLAADLGAQSFDPAELFVPDRNVQLGAFYLSRLLQRFDGRFSAAIASYNAGPEAVTRWLAAAPDGEDDEWVEAIPYDQTRSYVKRVLRSMHVYRTLYGS